MYSLMNVLLTSLSECLRTEAALERVRVLVHHTVPLVAASTTQHFAADRTLEHFFGHPLGRPSLKLRQTVLQLPGGRTVHLRPRSAGLPVFKDRRFFLGTLPRTGRFLGLLRLRIRQVREILNNVLAVVLQLQL